MDNKKIIEEATKKYQMLECEATEDYDIITVGNDDSPLVLNLEVGDNSMDIRIINKDDGSLVDKFDDDFCNEEEFYNKVNNAVTTFESIKETIGNNYIKEDSNEEIISNSEESVSDSLSDPNILISDIDNNLKEIGKIVEGELFDRLIDDMSISLEIMKKELSKNGGQI